MSVTSTVGFHDTLRGVSALISCVLCVASESDAHILESDPDRSIINVLSRSFSPFPLSASESTDFSVLLYFALPYTSIHNRAILGERLVRTI
jgi:hypothetical protein